MSRQGATLTERMATVEAHIDAIVEARVERDREIKAIKEDQIAANKKLDLLLEDKQLRDGATGLGRWLITIGIPSLVGGAVLWVWHLVNGKG